MMARRRKTFAQRLRRYLRVHYNLKALHRPVPSAEAIETVFGYEGGYFRPAQIREELLPLVERVRQLRPERVMEIGTAGGGTLYLWARMASPQAVIISVDLPRGPFGGGYPIFRSLVYRRLASSHQRIHLLRADSHLEETVNRVRRLLSGQKLDFLFVDGDHTYEGVKQDWQMYSPLVRRGGLIAFHDIATVFESREWGQAGVKRFWNELKGSHEYAEYVVPDSPYGIGVIEVD